MINDLLDEPYKTTIFFKVDLRGGYHHIKVKLEDAYKTIFRTHHMHFGLKVNAFLPHHFLSHFSIIYQLYFQASMKKCVFVFDKILE